MLVEHEYDRGGSLAYIAAWDVHRAKLFGRLEATTGIEPFGRLVNQVMTEEPYRSARRVFWVLDNGSSHRGAHFGESVHSIRRIRTAIRLNPYSETAKASTCAEGAAPGLFNCLAGP